MKSGIYIESSIPSYLTARTSRDLIKAAHQQITQEWWEQKNKFELYISVVVVEEISQGNQEAAQRRLSSVNNIPSLELNEDTLNY